MTKVGELYQRGASDHAEPGSGGTTSVRPDEPLEEQPANVRIPTEASSSEYLMGYGIHGSGAPEELFVVGGHGDGGAWDAVEVEVG